MSEQTAKGKFGPSYVAFQTPVTNVRMTTWFAGEAEVLLIDPTMVKVTQAYGCKLLTEALRKSKQ